MRRDDALATKIERMTNGKLQTLDRGLEVLLLIARTSGGIKVGDIATRLGLHRPIAYRIIATLADRAMVRRLEDGRIVLGSAAYLLGAKTHEAIRAAAKPVLESLAERLKATAFLSIVEGEECVVALTAEPRDAQMTIHYRVGSRHPVRQGAAGIAILAARPAHQDDTDDVQTARLQGYSVTQGQLHKGAVGVSSAVLLTDDGFSGLECSVGVVALEQLDLAVAAEAVPAAASRLAAGLN